MRGTNTVILIAFLMELMAIYHTIKEMIHALEYLAVLSAHFRNTKKVQMTQFIQAL